MKLFICIQVKPRVEVFLNTGNVRFDAVEKIFKEKMAEMKPTSHNVYDVEDDESEELKQIQNMLLAEEIEISDDDENEENSGSLPAALAPLSPSPEQSEAIGDRDVTMRSENASPQRPSQDEEQRSQESEISTGVNFVRVLQLISLF